MTGCLSLRINFLCKLEVSASFCSYISFMATAACSQLGAVFTQCKTDMATGHCCNLWCDQETLAHKHSLPGQGCSGSVLVFRCTYYPQPGESSSALDGSQMVVNCNHRGYRDSGSTQQLVPKWRIVYKNALAPTLLVVMYEGSSEPLPRDLSQSGEFLKLLP